LEACPFIAIVCVGTHNHPPLPPEKIPVDIKLSLQSLISQAIDDNNIITPRYIQSKIHQSLNSVDKLRILVAKAYKNMHPYGQGILGVLHAAKNSHSEIKDYVHHIEWINSSLILIICMLKQQADLLINLRSFQIDLAFKRIKGDINEFEINIYDTKNKLILSYCRIYTNVSSADGYKKLFCTLFETIEELTNENICVRHIHQKGWECIIGDLDAVQAKGLGLALYNIDPSRDWKMHLIHIFKSCIVHFQQNLLNKRFSQEIYNLAKLILNAPSQELVESILDKIKLSDEPGAKEWANYYKTPWIISSLNVHMSKMEHNIWRTHNNNTNSAESAHALVNKEGKQLNLLSAILRSTNANVRKRKIATTKNNNKRLHHETSFQDVIEVMEMESIDNAESISMMQNNNKNNSLLDIELEERKVALLEHQTRIRKEAAEVEAIELQNK
ncbi:7545_t:CDS:2, partial [Cetraspora pellucida]